MLAQEGGDLWSDYFLDIPVKACLAVLVLQSIDSVLKVLLCESVSIDFFF